MSDSALDAAEELAEAANVEKTCRSVVPGCLEQDVPGIVLSQDVVDEICGHRDLAPRLFTPWVASLDQAGDHRAVPKSALHQMALGKPGVEIVAEKIFFKELGEVDPSTGDHRGKILRAPDRQAVVVCDEAQRPRAPPMQAAREEHSEGLMGKPSFDRTR